MEDRNLHNIKRAYKRVMDRCMGHDMGWWFGERSDAMAEINSISTVREVYDAGVDLVEYLQENDYPEAAVTAARNWLARWKNKIGV